MFKRYLYNSYRRFSGLKYRFAGRVTKTGALVWCALFIAAALGLNTDLAVAYQTFAFLFCVSFMAWLGLSLNHLKFSVERTLPRFGGVGQKLRYQTTIHNLSKQTQRGLQVLDLAQDPRPSFDEFCHAKEPGEEKRNAFDRNFYRWQWLVSKNQQAVMTEHSLPMLPGRGQVEMEMELVPSKRGYLRLEQMAISCPEPFGLFKTLQRVAAPQSILILPKRYLLPAIDLPGITKYQQGGVAMAASIGESEEFVSLRDYRAGDPLRHIHWKSFAKTGKPIVKEFQDEFFVRHALILDTFGVPAHSEIFEEAVAVAASFAYTIQTQESLLDLMFVGPRAYCFTTGRGVGHLEQMLEILAAVQPCRDKSFQVLERLVLEHLPAVSGCLCIFVAWDQQRQDFVKQLKLMGMPLKVLVVMETETQLQPGPMADVPEHFHVLTLGKIGEGLARL